MTRLIKQLAAKGHNLGVRKAYSATMGRGQAVLQTPVRESTLAPPIPERTAPQSQGRLWRSNEAALSRAIEKKVLIQPIRTFVCRAGLLTVCLFLSAQGQIQHPAAPTEDSQAILGYVNQTLDWYRHIPVEESLAGTPDEVSFTASDKQLGLQILRLSFDYAKAEAQHSSATKDSAQNPPPASQFQALSQAVTAADGQVKDAETELQPLKQKLAVAEGKKRAQLQSQVDEVQSELDLAQARRNTIYNLLQFAGTAGSKQAGSGNLQEQLDEIERSVAELATTAQRNPEEAGASPQVNYTAPASPSPSANVARPAQPSGVVALIEDLLSQAGKIRAIDQTLGLTNSLTQSMQRLRSPLITGLTADAQRGDQLLKEPDSTDPAALAAQRNEFEGLTADFKRDSAMVLPLGKQAILLSLYSGNLSRWSDSVKNQYKAELRSLFLRLSVLAVALIMVVGVSEIWRRAAFRYIRDQRRRHQILFLRRILLWTVVSVTVILFFATEIGSLATFAGLITAGIAVALQNLILSVAGYFFLIGKYGVKVGDRVQISGITGEVIDVGLVRTPLLELGGSGSTLQPTGRVVVFSNSVVFQPNANFFKQIPGTHFAWHEVTLNLAPDCDYRIAEKRMLEAVDKVFSEYRASMEQQHRQMEQAVGVGTEQPRPRSRLRLNQGGLEVVIRYPVELESASAIDDRITRELLEALDSEPRLRLVASGTPNIQPVSIPAEQAVLAEVDSGKH